MPTPAAPSTVQQLARALRDRALERGANAPLLLTRSTIAVPVRAGRGGASRATPSSRKRLDRLGLALDGQRRDRLGLDGVRDEPVGVAAEQDLARPRRLLEPRRDVDRVAGGERAAGDGRAGHRLAGVEPDPDRELDAARAAQLLVQLGHPSRMSSARPDRAQRVVLVRDGDPEHRHQRVADVALDRAAVALDGLAHGGEPALHRPAQRLVVDALAQLGRADDVGEHDRDDLAPLARGRQRPERRTARGAESGARRRLLAAA